LTESRLIVKVTTTDTTGRTAILISEPYRPCGN